MRLREKSSGRGGVAKLHTNVQQHGAAHDLMRYANTFSIKGALTFCGAKSAFSGVTK